VSNPLRTASILVDFRNSFLAKTWQIYRSIRSLKTKLLRYEVDGSEVIGNARRC